MLSPIAVKEIASSHCLAEPIKKIDYPKPTLRYKSIHYLVDKEKSRTSVREQPIDSNYSAKSKKLSYFSKINGKLSLIINGAGIITCINFLSNGPGSVTNAFFVFFYAILGSTVFSQAGIILSLLVYFACKKENTPKKDLKTARWGLILSSISLLLAIGFSIVAFGLGWM